MSLAFVGETANPPATLSGTSATTQTCTRTVTAGNALIAFCMGIGTATTVTFSDGVNTWTTDTTLTPLGGGFQCLATGHALNVAGGSTTVTATWNASVHHSFVILVEVSGAKTASALEGIGGQFQNPGGTGTDAVTSGNPSPAPTTTANTFVCGFICDFNNNVAPTAVGTGFTQTGAVKYTASMGGVQGEYKIVSATGTYPATFTCTTSDNWSTFVVILAEAAAASQVPPPPRPGTRLAAMESWLAPDVQVTQRRFTAPKIDGPSPVNPNLTTDRLAVDAWWSEYGPPLVRRPMVVQPKIDNPPVLPWTSSSDRIAVDSWPVDYGAARRPMLTAPRIDNPPLIQPLSAADRAAAETWTPEEVRPGRRQVLTGGVAPSGQPAVGPPNTARAAADTWPIDYGAARRPTWTDGAHDQPPPRAIPPFSASGTWAPDEIIPRAGARTTQSVDDPPRRGPIASAWAAVESWLVELAPFRRQPATDGAHDAPPPWASRVGSPTATWQPEEQTRSRAAAAPQAPATIQPPPARSQVAPAQTWEIPESPAAARARFTAPAIDAPAPRVPFARWAADSWAPADDTRPRSTPAPQAGQQVDNPAPRGALASVRAALETWLADAGAARRTNVTTGQVDQPPSFSPTGTLRTASESWTTPDTRLPPRYQPQLPPPTNQPTPVGNVDTLRALIDSWLVEFGWIRRPTFTPGQADQPVPLPWTSTSDRVAFDSWASPESAAGATARGPQPAGQPPAPPVASTRAAAETWTGEQVAPRRAAPVVPGSVDAPPPRSTLASMRAAVESWIADALSGQRRAVVVPGSIDAPAPRAPAQHGAAATWEAEGGRQRKPVALVQPAPVDNPPPVGGRSGRTISWATWEVPEHWRNIVRPIASALVPWLPGWLVASLGSSDTYSIVDSSDTFSKVLDDSETFSLVLKADTED